jgi:hypothetical protein
VYTNSTYSSVKSDDTPSLFDSSSSVRTSSDTSSARGSILSNVSARTAKLLGRKSHTANNGITTPQSISPNSASTSLSNLASSATPQGDVDNTDAASIVTTSSAKQKGTFMCGFCKEEGVQKTCTRKNDLKRHIEDFHNMNAQWHCHQRGCGKVFDWQTVYKTHLKIVHGGSRMALDEARVDLCPQTVFACGFDNCIQVFESQSDADAASTFKEFVAHVVKHLDEGSNSGDWTYSTRIRNLMRQSGTLGAWSNSSWPETERNRLTWHPQTSGTLRKRLETRHLGDLRMLIQYAIALGSDPSGVPEVPESLKLPVKGECHMHIPGHEARIHIQQQQQHPPPSPAQRQPPSQVIQQQTPEPDPYHFRISRGNGANPQLANFYAQRRMATTRPPVRSGRSARPPTHGHGQRMPGNSMAPQGFQQPAAPSMYDPMGYYNPQAAQQMQHQQQQQYPVMTAADGGIIADDLRSLRSMASSNASSADIDMSDAQMLDSPTSYMGPPQQGFDVYGANGLQSPDGIKMEQTQFGGYDAQNGY